MFGNGMNEPAEDDEYKFDYDMGMNPALGTSAQLKPDGSSIPGTSLGRGPPGTQARGAPPSRMMTSQGGGSAGEARPMTSVKGAGYQSNPSPSSRNGGFDPLNQGGGRGAAPALLNNSDSSPEKRAKKLEKQVNASIEESALARVNKEYMLALEKAKEAEKKERQLCKFRDKSGLVDQINLELTYAMSFNLANCYHLNEMFAEAINTYSYIVKNKQYPHSGRLRVNMGNIYFEQKKYPNAVKMYRMALDQISNNAKEVRFRIMRNIGIAFVKLGQFQDAIQSFEAIMEGFPDHQSGFNLIVCYFALGDTEKMKKGFLDLVAVPVEDTSQEDDDDDDMAGVFGEGEEKDGSKENMDITGMMMGSNVGGVGGGDGSDAMFSGGPSGELGTTGQGAQAGGKDTSLVGGSDTLKLELQNRQKEARGFVLKASKLIAPCLDKKNWVNGYDWVVEALSSAHSQIASEMEISKAIAYLRKKDFEKAIEALKAFEKKEPSLKAKAATNLSFLYFLEGDIAAADKYANLAVQNDRYNAKALVNKGNCLMVQGELERAKELFLEAIGVEADCSEAIFNLGLVNRKLGKPHEALQAFEKLHSIIPNSPEVIFHIANLCDQLGNFRAATKWFNILVTRVPTDPGVLSRLGQIFNKEDDESQAFHYHFESYRYYPVNLDVISWLGVWYVKSELYERAIEFFERASQIQPTEVKWRLMVTSCYRRMGAYQKSLKLYERIHKDYPENLECLRYLVAICKDLGMKHDKYQAALSKLERSAASMHTGNAGDGQLTMVAGMGAPGGGGGGGAGAQQQGGSRRNMSAIGENDEEEEDAFRGAMGGGGGSQQGGGPPMGMDNNNGDEIDEADEHVTGRARRPSVVNHSIGAGGQQQHAGIKADESDDWGDADLDDLLAD